MNAQKLFNPVRVFFTSCIFQGIQITLNGNPVFSSTLLLVDSGGSVYEYKEGRNSAARCIFTGCRGEVSLLIYLNITNISDAD
jgi:hypothetical protein